MEIKINKISLFLLIFLAFLTSCSKKNEIQNINTASDSVLIISGENYPPYFFLENNTVKGINAEIYQYVFNKLGIEYELNIYPWSRVWKMVQNGQIDAVDSTSHKKYREPYLYYTEEQKHFPEIIPEDKLFMQEYVFFTRKIYVDFLPEDFTLDEIKQKGYRIGIIRDNSYFEDFWAANFTLKKYPDVEQCLKAVSSGEIDLYPADKTIGLYTAAEYNLSTDITYHKKILYSKPQYLLFTRLSTRKEQAENQDKFNKELILFKNTPIYKNIINKYIVQ